jgi:hypothetical protein
LHGISAAPREAKRLRSALRTAETFDLVVGELYKGDEIFRSFDFRDAELIMKLEDGAEEVARSVSDTSA